MMKKEEEEEKDGGGGGNRSCCCVRDSVLSPPPPGGVRGGKFGLANHGAAPSVLRVWRERSPFLLSPLWTKVVRSNVLCTLESPGKEVLVCLSRERGDISVCVNIVDCVM